jgi:preprotein translocase SecE subunit
MLAVLPPEIMQFSRYINLSFVVAWVTGSIVLAKTGAALFRVFEITDRALLGDQLTATGVGGGVVAAIATIYAWKRADVQTWAGEIAVELAKVTWPGWEETKQNTMVVLVFAVVLAGIVASFDFVWKWLTDLILLQG